jgi:ubiquinone/menaquinone biosynthesis C-methylase UbiE
MLLRDLPAAALKYFPIHQDQNAFVVPEGRDPDVAPGPDGLPMPPAALLEGYADSAENYLFGGELNARDMIGALATAGIELRLGDRILDFGCGIARMTRQLRRFAEAGEVWGVDIKAGPILWCKRHLSPPFRFATTTTIPHLPFRDGHFDLVFAGSVFTHIDDLADAWLAELRRVLKKGGCAYLTIHDESTVEMLKGPYAGSWVTQMLEQHPLYVQHAGRYGMLAIERDTASQIFYSRTYFEHMLAASFDLLAVVPRLHGYQTAYIARARE